MDTDVTVLGAGIVGLSVSYYLSKYGYRVILLEKEKKYGLGVSSRSTEVIHSGAYYQTGSLKRNLCIRGKELIYDFCEKNNILYKRVPKLFLAITKDDLENISRIEEQAKTNGLEDLKILDRKQLKNLEPSLNGYSALLSPSSGVFDVSNTMHVLAQKCLNNGVIIAENSEFEGAEFSHEHTKVRVLGPDPITFKTKFVINAAGIDSTQISKKVFNSLTIPSSIPTKGCYARYSGKLSLKHIIYPSFTPGQIVERVDATPDIYGNLRFGPSIEESTDISDYSIPNNLIKRFTESIKKYLPEIDETKITPDYAAFRPKIKIENNNNPDFIFNFENSGYWLDLWGMESPAVTASLAVGEYVKNLISKI